MKINISKNDLILIIFASIFSAACFYFWFNYKPTGAARNMESIATLGEFSQDVRWKIYGNFEWIKPNNGAGLISGDQIFTGNDSSAVVKFIKSNSTIVIHSNSLVTILENEDRLILDIQKGSFDLESGASEAIVVKNKGVTQEIPVSDKGLTVKASSKGAVEIKNKIITLPNILYPKENGRYEVEENIGLKLSAVFSGRVEISSDRVFSEVMKSFDIKNAFELKSMNLDTAQKYYLRLVRDDLISPVLSFEITKVNVIALASPKNEEMLVLDRGAPVTFSWDNPNNENDTLRIFSKDKLIKEVNTKSSTQAFHLPHMADMSWEVERQSNNRLLAKSKRSEFDFEYLKMKTSDDILKFYNVDKKPVQIDVPLLPNEKIKAIQTNIARSSVLNTLDVSTNKVMLPSVTPGHYYLDLDSQTYPASEKSSIEFKAFADVVSFKGIKDKNKNSYSMVKELVLDEAQGTIDIGYESAFAVQNLLINLKVDGVNMPKLVRNINTKTNSHFEIKLASFSEYCLTVRHPEKELVEYFLDNQYCFKVSPKKYFNMIANSVDMILARDPLNKKDSYIISLPPNEHATTYVVQIYNGPSLKKAVYTGKSKSNIINFKSKQDGVYYYRYKLIDKNGNESSFSNAARLIFPISPFSGWNERKP